jgi:hypothetical protein
MHFPEEGSVLIENQAKWHKQRHQKFNNTRLDRAKQKREGRRMTDRNKPEMEASNWVWGWVVKYFATITSIPHASSWAKTSLCPFQDLMLLLNVFFLW